jgi:hypothetical protein
MNDVDFESIWQRANERAHLANTTYRKHSRHCRNGHLRTAENTYVQAGTSYISCRDCARKPNGIVTRRRRLKFAPPGYKTCRQCGVVKERREFSPNRVVKDGLFSYCHACCAKNQRAKRVRNG